MNEQLQHTLSTRRGTVLHVRTLTPADAPLLVDIFEHMSADSRYRRFNQPLSNPDPELIEAEAAELADVTPDEGEAWIAFVEGEQGEQIPVAGMRYIRIGEAEAEASIAVRDDYQGQGIGTALLQFTAQQAHAAGIRRLVGMIQYENVALKRILNKIPLPVQRQQDGPDVLIEIDLTPLGK